MKTTFHKLGKDKSIMKILHTADWHIDANIIEAGRVLQFMVGEASVIQPDLTVISGDMFNSADVRLDTDAARLAMMIVTKLAEYSRHGVIILIGTPSHDGNAAKIFEGLNKVIVADYPNSIIYDVIDQDYKSFVVSVMPQPTKQYLESVASGDIEDVNQKMLGALNSIFTGFGSAAAQYEGPHICLGHFSVRGAKISPTQQMMGYDIEMSTDQLALANADLWCLGHIHHAQEVSRLVYYSGSPYRVDFGERESDKGFYVHSIDRDQADRKYYVGSEFIKTPAATMAKKAYDVTGGLEDPDEIHYDKVEIADKMQVEIKCYADQAELVDYHIIRENLIQQGAKEVDVIIQRIPRANIRSAKILAVDRLREKLIARAELTDDEIPAGTLDKADMVETMKSEAVLNLIKKQFEKGDTQ
jgi:DNA repair exonuclease SbcCD nuclease subunit